MTKFAAVGGIATLVHITVAVLLIHFAHWYAVQANALAFATAFFVSFFGHHRWTFRSRLKKRHAFWRFLLVQGSGFAANNFVLVSLLRLHLMPQIAATIVSLAAIPIASYIFSRLWAFNE